MCRLKLIVLWLKVTFLIIATILVDSSYFKFIFLINIQILVNTEKCQQEDTS